MSRPSLVAPHGTGGWGAGTASPHRRARDALPRRLAQPLRLLLQRPPPPPRRRGGIDLDRGGSEARAGRVSAATAGHSAQQVEGTLRARTEGTLRGRSEGHLLRRTGSRRCGCDCGALRLCSVGSAPASIAPVNGDMPCRHRSSWPRKQDRDSDQRLGPATRTSDSDERCSPVLTACPSGLLPAVTPDPPGSATRTSNSDRISDSDHLLGSLVPTRISDSDQRLGSATLISDSDQRL